MGGDVLLVRPDARLSELAGDQRSRVSGHIVAGSLLLWLNLRRRPSRLDAAPVVTRLEALEI